MDLQVLQALAYGAMLMRSLFALPSAIKQFQQSSIRWELENIRADLTLKARGHIMPVLVERLDDGTDPINQHLLFDIAPIIARERIDKALYYRQGQTLDNLLRIIFIEIVKQGIIGAETGEERAIKAQIDVFTDAVRITWDIHGRVGSNFEVVTNHLERDFWRFQTQIPARVRVQMELQKAARAKRKSEGKSA